MERISIITLLPMVVIASLIPLVFSSGTYGNDSSVVDDLKYIVNWRTSVSGIERVSSLIDYSGDGVNDVVGIGNYTVLFLDGADGELFYNYTVDPGYRLYTLTPVGDLDGNGYNEIAIISVNNVSRVIKMDLVEPGTSTIRLTQNYTLPDPNEYNLVPAVHNGILEDNILSIVISGIKVEQSVPPRIVVKTWVYRFDLVSGAGQPVDVIDGKAYTLWTNRIPADDDGDGYIDIVSSITVKGYIRFEIGFMGVKIYGGVEVKEPVYQWSSEDLNRIPIATFKPYSLSGRLVVAYVIISVSGTTPSAESIRFIGYRLGNGQQRYSIDVDLDQYMPYGLSIAGNTLVIDIVDKDNNHGLCRFYEADNGYLLGETDFGDTGDGAISSMSIGDFDGDNSIDLIIAVDNKLYYLSLSNDIDYLGDFPAPIYVNDGSTIFYGNQTYYALLLKTDDYEEVYTVYLVENDTTPPEVEIIYPLNNSIVSTPFNVSATVIEDLSEITNVSLKIYSNGSLVALLPMEYDSGTASAYTIVDILDDGEYDLCVEAYNSNGLRGSNTIRVVVDNTPPIVSITANPENGSRVVDVVQLYIEVNDLSLDNITILVNGEQYGIYSSSPVNETIDLMGYSDGWITIEVKAYDKADHVSTAILQYWKDSKPPVINIDGLSNESIVSGLLNLSINILDDTSAYTIVYLDGSKTTEYNGTGTYTLTIDTREYSDGEHTLVIVSKDYMGLDQPLVARKLYVFTIDNSPPLLTVAGLDQYYRVDDRIYVVVGDSNSSSVKLGINVEDISLDKLSIYIRYVNGYTYNETIDISGEHYTYNLSIMLNTSLYASLVQISVYDIVGHNATDQYIFILHYMKPSTASRSDVPAVGKAVYMGREIDLYNTSLLGLKVFFNPITYNIQSLTVSGGSLVTIDLDTCYVVIYKYDVNGTRIINNITISPADTWYINITLEPGIYKIEAHAIDVLGLESTYEYMFAVDTGAPRIASFNIETAYVDTEYAVANISWSITDDLWIEEAKLIINNTVYTIDPSGSLTVNLTPGIYSIVLNASDPIGRWSIESRTLEIEIPGETTTPPQETSSPSPTSTTPGAQTSQPQVQPTTQPSTETTPATASKTTAPAGGMDWRTVAIVVIVALAIIVYAVYRLMGGGRK